MSKGRGFDSAARGGPSFFKRKSEPRQEEDEVPEEELMFPDYAFPIVAHFIPFAEFAHLRILSDYISLQTNACNGMPSPYGSMVGHMPLFVSPSEMCVLFMRWDIVSHLDTLKNAQNPAQYYHTLNDVTFLNKSILGHAKILNHPPYLAIYNFCKHMLTLVKDVPPSTREIPLGPIGFEMFTALLTTTQLLPGIGHDTILWLGIDLNNPAFSKVANIYTVSGFSDPIITNMDVTGVPLPINILQLTRPLHAHESRHLESTNNFNQVMNLVADWRVSVQSRYNPADWAGVATSSVVNYAGRHARIMRYRFSFDKSCIMSLHLFPYLSFNAQKGAIGVTQMAAQCETSGKFVSIKSVYNPDDPETGYDVLAIETTSVSRGHALQFNVGTASSVQMEWGATTFHTHPVINYQSTSTKIAPPSCADFSGFVRTFLFFQSPAPAPAPAPVPVPAPGQIHPNQSFKFSLVSTVEGVHIISLTPQGIVHFTNMIKQSPDAATFDAHLKRITDKYEYDLTKRQMIWQVRPITEPRSQEALHAPIEAYAAWFEETNRANGNLFEWNFVSWDEFNTRHQIEGYYLENRINLPPPP